MTATSLTPHSHGPAKQRRHASWVGLAAFLAIAPLPAQAAVYYVSTSGNDSNSGTSAAPWRTIHKAANTAVAGDTVHVAAGTYSEAQVDFMHSGTASAPIVFVSDTKWGANFRWASSQSANHVGFNLVGNHITIQNFDVAATANNTSMMVGIQAGGVHDRIIGNRVHDFIAGDVPGAGIADVWTAPRQYTEIIGNWVHNIGTTRNARSQGIYPQNYGEVVQNNVVFNCAAWGIHAYHAATNETITNNLVFGNKNGGILAEAAPTSDGNPGVRFDNSVIANNIVINNGGTGISNSSSALVGSGNKYLNNFVYGNAKGAFSLGGNSSYVMSANVTTLSDPGFINYQADGSGDYHLKGGSPAIDKGVATGAPSTDFDGHPRPQGAGYDIGAYEYRAEKTGQAQKTDQNDLL